MKIHCKYDELINPKKLKPHPRNRNEHEKDQIERMAEILEYQGWRRPVTVSNLSGFITTGHCRTLSAILRKWKEVPVVYQDYENEDQEYADVTADNAIAAWAILNFSKVNADLEQLGSEAFNIDWLGIKNFSVGVDDDFIKKINSANENEEWIGMPSFEKGENYIRLLFHFKTEDDRAKYVKKNKIEIDKKLKNLWLVLK